MPGGAKRNRPDSRTAECESHVRVFSPRPACILSSAEHEEFCVNLPGPSGKAKYSRETDSEQVP